MTPGFTAAVSQGASLRRLLMQAKEGPFPAGNISQSRPISDPNMQAGLSQHSLYQTSIVCEAVITDVTAICNCYRVRPEKFLSEITATLAPQSSLNAFGARQLQTLQPGSKVLIVWHPGTYFAVILGVIPFAQTAGNKHVAQQLFQSSRNRVDESHIQPMKMGGGGFVTDWLAGRPFDATNVGEQGWISETGTRCFVDPWLAMLGVDEACSLVTFYHDQLMRIGAYNLRMFTAGSEREAMDDQGEYNDWTGYTPYPWEQMGLYSRGNPSTEKSPQQFQVSEPHYGNVEPVLDNQRPWHREIEYHGYLGQGGTHFVQAPPVGATGAATFDPDSTTQFPGLSVFHRALDGRVILGSAKGVSIVKRSAIISPTRKYVPEQIDDEGDSPSNYMAAGIAGSGPSHVIESDIAASGDNPELVRAAGVLDLHAYWFNYGIVHPFFYHEKDWHVPDETTLQHTQGQTLKIPNYSLLQSSVFLSVEDLKISGGLDIDHRISGADYWQTECGLDLLDDGGLVLYDGWGSELKLTSGSAWLTAPGDVWMQPGRTAVIWGGDDVVIRAQNSMDLTTTDKDVRIKAQKNLHMLSGNGGIGGTLIESRGADAFEFEQCGEDVISGGVFLRAERGTVGSWARNVYLRTGGGDISGGDIILDADKGKRVVITHAKQLVNFVGDAALFHWGTDGDVESTTFLSGDTSVFASDANCFNGDMFADGSLITKGNILVAEGHIATEKGCSTPLVGCLEGESLQEAIDAVDACVTIGDELLPDNAKKFYKSILETSFYDENKPGNDDVISKAEFSLRNEEQYGTDNGFLLYEARWQRMGRASGALTNRWQEVPVECRSDPETYPFPGKTYYQGGAFIEVDNSIFEISGTSGRARSKGSQPNLQSPYNNPQYADPAEPKGLNQYPVIRGR